MGPRWQREGEGKRRALLVLAVGVLKSLLGRCNVAGAWGLGRREREATGLREGGAGRADFWVWAGFGFPISLVFLSFLFQTHSN